MAWAGCSSSHTEPEGLRGDAARISDSGAHDESSPLGVPAGDGGPDATVVSTSDATAPDPGDDGSADACDSDACFSIPVHLWMDGDELPPEADVDTQGPLPQVCEGGATSCWYLTDITPGTHRGNAVMTCDTTGAQWGAPVACDPSTPFCDQGHCVATAPTGCDGGGTGLSDCGNGESCCASLSVPGGSFYRTYDYDGKSADGGPILSSQLPILAPDGGPIALADPATLSDYVLDKYPVTVARFRRFMVAWNAGWSPPVGSGKHVHLNAGLGLLDVGSTAVVPTYEPGWLATDSAQISFYLACDAGYWTSPSTWTQTPGALDDTEITCVSWYEARAFCIWDGGFLPSEAEEGYAAAGGDEQRAFPWGSAQPSTGAYATTPGLPGQRVGSQLAGAGRWGQLGLFGTGEWVVDEYADFIDPCIDCARTTPPGGWGSDAAPPPGNWSMRGLGFAASSRGSSSYNDHSTGFRCARSPFVAGGTCSSGSSKCIANAPWACPSGQWVPGAACSNQTCVAAACTGSCAPGQTQCTSGGLQECATDGTWGAAAACPFACANGACYGVCTPGSSQCSNNGVQTCGTDYQWGAAAACTGQTCVAGACKGVCAPGQTQCASGGLQTCASDGSWGAATACPYTCANGACTGSCLPSSTRCVGNGVETCGSDYQWGAVAACDVSTTCVSGACAGVCGPTQSSCSGSSVVTCDVTGHWAASWPCATGMCTAGSCAGQTTTGTSCQVAAVGSSDCGATGESCCTSLEVPGGTFFRTYDDVDGGVSAAPDGGPVAVGDPATLSGFRLDKYDVTVGRFRQFVNAWNGGSGYMPSAGSGKHAHLNGGSGLAASDGSGTYEPGWTTSAGNDVQPTDANLQCNNGSSLDFLFFPTWTSSPGNQERLPIDCVTWDEAYAFCIWDGGFLPSEAEWEYATAGGSAQRLYPWGSSDPGGSNQYAIYNCDYPPDAGSCMSGMAPVGTASLGAGLWGQMDLAGNVVQWTYDYYASFGYPCVNCAALTASDPYSTNVRVARGSDFARGAPLDNLERSHYVGYYYRSNMGFRCARSP